MYRLTGKQQGAEMMKKLMVEGTERILLDANDVCPICETKRENMRFSWNMFHGEATSSCCGAVFQIKDYHIDNPNDEQKELLEGLRGDYIEFNIKREWVEPLKQAIEKVGITDINNGEVMEEAKAIIAANNEGLEQ